MYFSLRRIPKINSGPQNSNPIFWKPKLTSTKWWHEIDFLCNTKVIDKYKTLLHTRIWYINKVTICQLGNLSYMVTHKGGIWYFRCNSPWHANYSIEEYRKLHLNCCRVVDHTQEIIFYGSYTELQKRKV